MKNFILKEGISICDTKDCESCFCVKNQENLVLSLSADKLREFTDKALKLLKAPVFFFAEIPCTESEEKELGGGLHRNVYYLDNCTCEVCQAILKRYGDLLFSDGLIQFGFGSHIDNSEIYLQKYQVISIYSPDISPFEKLTEQLDIKKSEDFKTLWSVIGKENPGECFLVEANGETIYDMIENLTEAGLYKAHVSEDE